MLITFYSYKGGVGRTTLALEVAARLARGGLGRDPLRVLVWDLDLEAPGVAHFEPFSAAAAGARAGTADLLDLLWAPQPTAVSDTQIERVLSKAIVEVQFDDTVAAGAGLGFLPPGRPGPGRALFPPERLRSLDLPALFTAGGHGPSLVAQAARIARDRLGWEIVVVDARTGLSDLASTAGAIADTAVMVFRLDGQDLANLTWLARSFVRPKERPGAAPGLLDGVIRVANMVPTGLQGSDVQLLSERLDELDTQRLTPVATIPLYPAALLREAVLTGPGGVEDPRHEAYEDVTAEVYRRWGLYEPRVERPGAAERGARAVAQGAAFELEVAALLRLLGMEVTVDYQLGAGQFDLIAVERGRLADDEWLIECKSAASGVTLSDIEKFAGRASTACREANRQYRTMIVAKHRIAGNARHAASLHRMEALTVADLMQRLAPLDELRQTARDRWFGSPDEAVYVEPRVRAPQVPSGTVRPLPPRGSRTASAPGASATGAVRRWIEANRTGMFVLLGDFGAGKSTFCRRLAAQLAGPPGRAETESEGTHPADRPLALVADLRDLGNVAIDVPELVIAALRRTGVSRLSWPAWERRLTAGEVMLVVDGLDELLSGADPAVLHRLVTRLVDQARSCRVVLTSRTQYFKSHAEALSVLVGPTDGLRLGLDHRTDDRQARGLAVFELAPFDEDQILEYLRNAFGARALSVRSELAKVKDLLSRPFLLALIRRTVDYWEREGWPGELTLSRLYADYASGWMSRDASKLELVPELAGAPLLVVERMARDLWARPGHGLGSDELGERIPGWVADATGHRPRADETDRLVRIVQTALFLSRNDDGDYRFAHRSFHEYFLAESIVGRMCKTDHVTAEEVANALDVGELSSEVLDFLTEAPEPIRRELSDNAGRLLQQRYIPEASENAVRIVARLARAAHVPPSLAGSHLAGAGLERIDLSDSDLAGADLRGARLSGAVLVRSHLGRADLTGADLTGADISFVRAPEALLDSAVMDSAKGIATELTAASLTGVKATNARFDGACLRLASLAHADIRMASLRFSDFSGTDLDDTHLRCSDLTGARLDRNDRTVEALRSSVLRETDLKAVESPPDWRVTGAATGVRPAFAHTGAVQALAVVPTSDGHHLLASAGSLGSFLHPDAAFPVALLSRSTGDWASFELGHAGAPGVVRGTLDGVIRLTMIDGHSPDATIREHPEWFDLDPTCRPAQACTHE